MGELEVVKEWMNQQHAETRQDIAALSEKLDTVIDKMVTNEDCSVKCSRYVEKGPFIAVTGTLGFVIIVVELWKSLTTTAIHSIIGMIGG